MDPQTRQKFTPDDAGADVRDILIPGKRRGETRSVTIKVDSLIDLVMAGSIPLPLLHATLKFRELQENLDTGGAEALLAMTDDHVGSARQMLQRIACAVVVDPVFVLPSPDGEPPAPLPAGAVAVAHLRMDQLMAIFDEAMKPGSITRPSEVAAEDFCDGAQPAPGPAVPDGPDVRAEAEQLDGVDRPGQLPV